MKIWSLDTVTRGRKGALLMLALMVFWTAAPASVCLLAMPVAGQHGCCDAAAMTLTCAPAGMTVNGSCCQVSRPIPAVPPVPLSSSERLQRLAFVANQAALQVSTSSGAVYRNALEAPPPKSSPGGISILRI